MPGAIESLVKNHPVAAERRAACKPVWDGEVDIKIKTAMQPVRIIGKQPDEIGGDYATTILSEDHQGPVSLVVRSTKGTRAIEATFPSLKEANRAACYAVSPNGGYSEVELTDGAGHPVTHSDWQEWAL